MKGKLLALNLALLALIAFVCWRLRIEWAAAKERERATFARKTNAGPKPAFAPLPKTQPAPPANYIDIAQKMLLSKDRNPVVVVEPPPPPPPPPPPKPMPALPLLYGVLDFGAGPTAIMSEKAGGQHRSVQPGEKVGEFTLVALNSQEITLEWDGKQLVKRLDELASRGPTQEAVSAQGVTPGQSTPPPAPAPAKPGVSMGAEMKACQAGDTSPPGTVADGMKKIVTETPFGPSCRWEPVK